MSPFVSRRQDPMRHHRRSARVRRESALQGRVFRSSKVKGFSPLVLRLRKRPLPRKCNSLRQIRTRRSRVAEIQQWADLRKVAFRRLLKRAPATRIVRSRRVSLCSSSPADRFGHVWPQSSSGVQSRPRRGMHGELESTVESNATAPIFRKFGAAP